MKKDLLFLNLLTICLALTGLPAFAQPTVDQHYDVVVAGAGTSGVSAAIQAARMGARVALLEESDWIGGQMAAAGVGTMDEGVGPESTPPSGIYAEFLDRARAYYKHYGKSMSTCYWRSKLSHCIAPSVARKILTEMINDVNAKSASSPGGHIDLFLQDRVIHVTSSGDIVTGVITSRNQRWSSSVLIDATEYGDVIPLTPARYRIGHSIDSDNGSSCVQAITWAAEIKKYPDGPPKELVLRTPPPDYKKWKLQFEESMRNGGDPSGRALPVGFDEYVAYRGLPDISNPVNYTGVDIGKITRTSMNWFNDFDVTTNIFDRSKRQHILCEAKLKTLDNLFYIQHEMGETRWSVANDEGFDTPYNEHNSCPEIPVEYKAIEYNLPQIPYVRESIRLVGEYTLTGGDIRRESNWGMSVRGFTDAIAVGDYADDLHSCNAKPGFFESDLEHITDLPPGFRFGPFQVPLRSLIPEKVDGFLAAEKNISQSRLANGATRLQPITMLDGQAAGALAALAVTEHRQPRHVPPQQVQLALLKSGDILARQHVHGLEVGSKPWQAVEFALVHGWIGNDRSKEFDPQKLLTRAEGAHILFKAFLENNSTNFSVTNTTGGFDIAPRTLKQVYRDVPLYSSNFNVVTLLHDETAMPPCTRDHNDFCPNDALTVDDFAHSVAILAKKTGWIPSSKDWTFLDSTMEHVPQQITAESAAIILYNTVLNRRWE